MFHPKYLTGQQHKEREQTKAGRRNTHTHTHTIYIYNTISRDTIGDYSWGSQ